jgi:hypothetical protein
MKKFCPLLLVAMLIAFSSVASYAGTISDNNVGGVTPDFAVIGSIITDLMLQDGKAVCSATVCVSQSSADKVKFDITLYRRSGSTWTAVKSWSETINVSNSFARFDKTQSVNQGYDYRFTGTVTCYKNNSVAESVGVDSSISHY